MAEFENQGGLDMDFSFEVFGDDSSRIPVDVLDEVIHFLIEFFSGVSVSFAVDIEGASFAGKSLQCFISVVSFLFGESACVSWGQAIPKCGFDNSSQCDDCHYVSFFSVHDCYLPYLFLAHI